MLPLLLALGCPHQAETPALPAEPWFPLGRSELAPWSLPERDSWRDAMVAQDAFAMDAALDRQGRVWVATLEPDPDGAQLRVRVHDRSAWTLLPGVRLPRIRNGVVSLTTDSADRPVVAWVVAPDSDEPSALRNGWSRWTGEGWIGGGLPEIPDESEGAVGVVVVNDGVRVYRWLPDWRRGEHRVADVDVAVGKWAAHAVPHGRLWTTPSVGGRHEWAVLTPDSDAVLWSGPDVLDPPAPELLQVHSEYDDEGEPLPTPVPRGPALLADDAGRWRWLAARGDGTNAAVAASGDRTWLLEGYPHLVGTHYGNEVNRLAIWQEAGVGWKPLTAAHLPTGLLYFEDIRLLPTPAPTLVMEQTGGRVDVLRWTGRDWWGLDGEPSQSGELSAPERAASDPEFMGNLLQWSERDDDGDRLVSSRWTGTSWASNTTLRLPGGPWLSVVDAGSYHFFVRIEGTWDRLWGLMGQTPPRQMLRWHGASSAKLPPIEVQNPVPGRCGDREQPSCEAKAFVQLPDGTLLAAVHPGQPSSDRLSLDDEEAPPRAWELHRYLSGAWTLDGTLPGAWWRPVALGGGEPASLLVGDVVYMREAGVWREIESPGAVVMPRAVGLGGQRLLLSWITDPEFAGNPELGGRLMAAEFDGTRWLPRVVGLPERVAGDRVLAVGPDGTPWLAWTDAGEVLLRRWNGAAWEGVDGSGSGGGVSNSASSSDQPAIGFLDGKVCVAWIEASDQAPGVNVRCHAIP